jgi:hypothetical protein
MHSLVIFLILVYIVSFALTAVLGARLLLDCVAEGTRERPADDMWTVPLNSVCVWLLCLAAVVLPLINTMAAYLLVVTMFGELPEHPWEEGYDPMLY